MYHLTPALALAFRAIQRPNSGIRAAILEGPAGCGKTSAAEEFARMTGATLVYTLLHEQSDDQELFAGISVRAAVAGDSANVDQPGVLARAAELSHAGLVVLVLDELDKVRERTEYLLLDFLQTGRVPVRPGVHIQADPARLVVFVTTNGIRPLSDPLLRRCRRLVLPPMNRETMVGLVGADSPLPRVAIATAAKVGLSAGRVGGFSFTLQELRHLASDLEIAGSRADVEAFCLQWCARDSASRADVAGNKSLDSLWGEIRAGRGGK